MKKIGKSWAEILWDSWCILSVIGIWPRYIEPNLLSVSNISITIKDLPHDLKRIKILQFSDLHWKPFFSATIMKKIIEKTKRINPDLIVFTGDFLSRALLYESEELKKFLQLFHAPLGCFAILGNHDYDQFVTVNEKGEYDVGSSSENSIITKGFKRLFSGPSSLTRKVTDKAKQVKNHEELEELLKETPFQLLKNETIQISVKKTKLNICGLEEYMTGRLDLVKAFQHYDSQYPGIVLVHNPDAFALLEKYPGDLFLAGHTHGGQVNLPCLWKRLTLIENLKYKNGMTTIEPNHRCAYINRGISGIISFRWFSKPELTVFTLR